ncbi:MAG: terpene cyclase/mutase family protein [Planctomycetes bacterium]|nr:terpene cyclase/mutase family protein [Planctomycetota bacterium]
MAVAQDAAAPPDARAPAAAEFAKLADPLLDRALSFLKLTQRADGGWDGPTGAGDPAITALVAKCFMQSPRYGPRHPIVRRALDYMLTFVQPDGGIYADGQGLRNYHTSVCLMALAATKDPVHRTRIRASQEFLTDLQWDEAEGYESDSPWYGGAGYGRNKRPDLSNTQMMIEALAQSGLPAEHPVYRKATAFISRCQMFSATNDQPFAAGSADGGFVYTPVGGGESKAGTVDREGKPQLRSYGSMTYAGFKSLLHADVDRDDLRVQRALKWIRSHYTLDHNPNMPAARSLEGLYYYYFVFSKALTAWGADEITDAAGKRHDWRLDLARALSNRQGADGSFVNQADRWMEGNPYLVTAYAVLAIQSARGG